MMKASQKLLKRSHLLFSRNDKESKKRSSEESHRQVNEISGKIDKDAFGTECDMGEMSVDQQPGDESLTEMAKDKPVTILGKEKDLKMPTSEGSPREVKLIPGKMDKDVFGKELEMSDVSIDQQPSVTKFGEDKPAIVLGKEDAKKPTSVEESPRKLEEISGKIQEDAFVKESDIGDMSEYQLSDNESITKISENKPDTVHGRDKDVKKTYSEGYPRQVEEIPGKVNKDAFWKRI